MGWENEERLKNEKVKWEKGKIQDFWLRLEGHIIFPFPLFPFSLLVYIVPAP